MQKHFPDLNFSMEEMQQPLPIVARKLRLLHRQELSQVNWPQEAWKCQCSWHPRLKRALDAFEEDSVPSNENLSLTRGLVPRASQSAGQPTRPKKVGAGGAVGTVGSEVVVQQIGTGTKAKRTNDLHFETNSSIYVLSCEVGGVRDKLKADWDGQRFSHMRVQILRASHTKFAEEELKKHLEGKAPEDLAIKTPCMCAGSALDV